MYFVPHKIFTNLKYAFLEILNIYCTYIFLPTIPALVHTTNKQNISLLFFSLCFVASSKLGRRLPCYHFFFFLLKGIVLSPLSPSACLKGFAGLPCMYHYVNPLSYSMKSHEMTRSEMVIKGKANLM